MRMQRRLAALLWPVPLAFALGACTAQSATMPEPSYPPPSGYAHGPGGGYPPAQETVAVETAPTMHYVETYPPEPLYESVTASPGEDHVWVDGSWHWNGYEWVWIGGNWVPEQIGFVYIEPYYDYDGGAYVYQPGHWRRREHVPRGVIVRDHRKGRPIMGHYPRPHRPDRPDYRVPIERGKHPPKPPHAAPRPEDPGAPTGAPIVRDHRRDTWPGTGRGAPPPRSAPPPRHRGPDQAEPPTVPRRPPPDISSPPPRAIPSARPTPRSGPPAPRTGPGFGGVPPRAVPPQSGPPPRSVPGPRIIPRHTPPPARGGAGGPPPRGMPPPRAVPVPGAPPPRSAPPPRGTTPRSAPGPRVTPRHTPPPRSAPAPQGAPPQRAAPAGAPPRRRN